MTPQPRRGAPPPATEPADAALEMIGPYQIESWFGRGGMGEVCRAWDSRLDRRVAIKRIHGQQSGDIFYRERFRREARTAARINHPAIVQIYDILVDDRQDWIVMELVDGETLARRLRERGPLDLALLVRLLRQVAEGLAEAHDHGIVHRDIKADNVMVTRRGGAKILDFGLARPVALTESQARLTVEGALVGTPHAMSPEQAKGEKVIDHRSDLFSLGSLFYQAATGEHPFKADTFMQTLYRVCHLRHRPVRELRPEIPERLSRILDRLLEKDPARRLGDAGELAETLTHLAAPRRDLSSPPAELEGGLDGELGDPFESTQEPTPRTGERRQVTVLRCALSGDPGEDDPDLSELVHDDFGRLFQAVIEAHGGRPLGAGGEPTGPALNLYQAVFGYPRAREDSARRAVHTALELIARLAPAASPFPPEAGIAVRIAVHTGPAIVEPSAGGDLELDLGETAELAAALLEHAGAGTVAVSGRTRRLVGDAFRYELSVPPDTEAVASMDDPTEVWRVTAERDLDEEDELDRHSPLIGRRQELTLLIRLWRLARGSHGQAALLSGTAGIGKSRLVQSLLEHEATVDARRLVCRGYPHEQSRPFGPIIRLLRRLVRTERDDVDRRQALERFLGEHDQPSDSVPLLASLILSVPFEAARPLSPEGQRKKTLEAVLTLLLEIAERHTLLLIVEDLHWVDPSTRELLDMLVEQCPTVPMLLLFTARSRFQPPWRSSRLTHLTLGPLDPREMRQLVGHLAGGRTLPPEVLETILDKSDGLPLYGEEVTRVLLASGHLVERAEGFSLEKSLSRLTLPETLQDFLAARLDLLGPAKDLAQMASVLGRSFSHRLLAAVSALDEETLQGRVRILLDAELFFRRGFGERSRYTFKHTLIQEAAYQTLLPRRRRELHAAVARGLNEHFPELAWERPEILAHHYTEAEQAAPAVDFWDKAGQRAFERSANLEAIEHFRLALELVGRQPPRASRDQLALKLHTRLAPALIATWGYAAPEVEETFQRARSLCQQAEDTPDELLVLWGLCAFHMTRAELDKAWALFERLDELAEKRQDPDLAAQVAFTVGGFHFALGDFGSARRQLESALPALRPSSFLLGQDSRVAAEAQLGLTLWLLGLPDQALRRGRSALELARRLSHPFSEGYALLFVVWLHQLRGEVELVEERSRELVELASEQSFMWLLYQAELFHAWALASRLRPANPFDQSSAEEGLKRIRTSVESARRVGNLIFQSHSLALYIEVALRWSFLDEAAAALAEAGAFIEHSGERFYQAEIERLAGDLARARGDDVAAEAAWRRALATARRQEARILELRSAVALTGLEQSRGEPGEASDALGRLTHGLTEGGETSDLIQARELLEK